MNINRLSTLTKTYFLPIIYGVLFAFIFGSRLSYFFVKLSGRYFPEPFYFVLIIFFSLKSRHFGISFIKNSLIFALYISVLALSSPTSSFFATLNESYGTIRSLYVAIVIAFSFILSAKYIFNNADHVSFFLSFVQSFSLASIVLSYLSLSISLDDGSEVLSAYSGARSLQPYLAPFLFFLASTLRFFLGGCKAFRKLLLLSSLSIFMSLFVYYIGLSRVSLLSPIFIVFISVILSSFKLSKKSLVSFILYAILFLLVFIPIASWLSSEAIAIMLSASKNVMFETNATLSGYWTKEEILIGSLERLRGIESAIRFELLVIIILNYWLFLFPSSYIVPVLDQKIQPLFAADLPTANFLSVTDSGLAYLVSAFGIGLALYLFFCMARYFFRLHRAYSLSSSSTAYMITLVIASAAIFLICILYSTAPFLNMYLAFHVMILLILIFSVPPLLPQFFRKYSS